MNVPLPTEQREASQHLDQQHISESVILTNFEQTDARESSAKSTESFRSPTSENFSNDHKRQSSSSTKEKGENCDSDLEKLANPQNATDEILSSKTNSDKRNIGDSKKQKLRQLFGDDSEFASPATINPNSPYSDNILKPYNHEEQSAKNGKEDLNNDTLSSPTFMPVRRETEGLQSKSMDDPVFSFSSGLSSNLHTLNSEEMEDISVLSQTSRDFILNSLFGKRHLDSSQNSFVSSENAANNDKDHSANNSNKHRSHKSETSHKNTEKSSSKDATKKEKSASKELKKHEKRHHTKESTSRSEEKNTLKVKESKKDEKNVAKTKDSKKYEKDSVKLKDEKKDQKNLSVPEDTLNSQTNESMGKKTEMITNLFGDMSDFESSDNDSRDKIAKSGSVKIDSSLLCPLPSISAEHKTSLKIQPNAKETVDVTKDENKKQEKQVQSQPQIERTLKEGKFLLLSMGN